jgi:hypothetical protein
MPSPSEADAVTVIVPDTVPPLIGDVIETVGGVVSGPEPGGLELGRLDPVIPAQPALNNSRHKNPTRKSTCERRISGFALTVCESLISVLKSFFPGACKMPRGTRVVSPRHLSFRIRKPGWSRYCSRVAKWGRCV